MVVLCTWVKLLTDLQILSCELHKNAFGGPVPPGPAAGGAIALPPDLLAVIRGRGEGRGRKQLGIGVGRNGRKEKDVKWYEGWEGGGRLRVREGSIWIFVQGPRVLVTPLLDLFQSARTELN